VGNLVCLPGIKVRIFGESFIRFTASQRELQKMQRKEERDGKKKGVSAKLSSLSLRRYKPHQVPRVEARASLSFVQSTPSET
jgi:hypothetical protein